MNKLNELSDKVKNLELFDEFKKFFIERSLKEINKTLNHLINTKNNEFFQEIKTIVLNRLEKDILKVKSNLDGSPREVKL